MTFPRRADHRSQHDDTSLELNVSANCAALRSSGLRLSRHCSIAVFMQDNDWCVFKQVSKPGLFLTEVWLWNYGHGKSSVFPCRIRTRPVNFPDLEGCSAKNKLKKKNSATFLFVIFSFCILFLFSVVCSQFHFRSICCSWLHHLLIRYTSIHFNILKLDFLYIFSKSKVVLLYHHLLIVLSTLVMDSRGHHSSSLDKS